MNGIVPDIKIAIVDHDEDRRNAFERVLKSAEFPVGKFSSAEEFLASLDRRTTSCLILDVRQPGMSGIELQNPFRETTEPVPVIFITAEGDAAIRELVMHAGALGYLTQPVRWNLFLLMVSQSIAVSKLFGLQ